MPNSAAERRRFPRYSLPSMYTQVDVRRMDEDEFTMSGHAYDVSEGGLRFELDRALEPGSNVVLRLELPGNSNQKVAERRPVYVLASVVWVEPEDVEQGGPCRMAAVFREFILPADRERLLGRLTSGRYALAA